MYTRLIKHSKFIKDHWKKKRANKKDFEKQHNFRFFIYKAMVTKKKEWSNYTD